MKLLAGKRAWSRYCAAGLLALSTATVSAAEAAAESNVLVHLGNWAGYVIKGDFRSVSATWVQPAVTCTNPGVFQRVVPWVGLNGANGPDNRVTLPLMQTGAETGCISDAAVYATMPGLQLENVAAGLVYTSPWLANQVMAAGDDLSNTLGGIADGLCATGALGAACVPEQGSDGWWEGYPDPPVIYEDVNVNAGDVMHAAVDWDGHVYTMTLENRTRNWRKVASQVSDAPARTAEIVIEGHLDAALPGFTPVTFTEIEIDGKPLSAYDAQVYGIAATNRVLYPGPVDGSSFTLS
ncbi:G1 family glutamic endopeptidase [Nocardia yamanashiensis]|uniref:G1 family glutamic endopeptidase n=1 Tax=Nocardia yamanashiensis TaxID=209247 RepID=UPI00082FB7E2|nr:G1 family glutamic endopeptidase [Nocardia yamanashiensis]